MADFPNIRQMRPHELASSRAALGMTQYELGLALELPGDRNSMEVSIRRWETGRVRIPGPVSAAVKLLLERKSNA